MEGLWQLPTAWHQWPELLGLKKSGGYLGTEPSLEMADLG
jgi:hypothetical protein